MKYIFILIAAVFCFISCGGTDDVNTEPEVIIKFNDPNFEKCARDTIQKPTGDLLASDFQNATYLTCTGEEISDITGIEYMTELDTIWLYTNKIKSLEPLRNLKKVNYLDAHSNEIESVEPLSGMVDMTQLMLSENNIGNNISSLQGMTKLSRLWISQNNITSLDGIEQLTSVEDLRIHTNQIVNISPLSSMVNLKSLDMSLNKISNIEAVKPMLNLTKIVMGTNCITDFAPIDYLKANGKLKTVEGNTAADQKNCSLLKK